MEALRVEKPWGHFKIIHWDLGYQVKRIEVDPGQRLSLQKHQKRAEKWVIVKGEGKAVIGGKEIAVKPGSVLDAPAGTEHRMQNTGETPLAFIEVQLGTYLGEDDIVRLQDDYDRK